jgi:hypothetical protein
LFRTAGILTFGYICVLKLIEIGEHHGPEKERGWSGIARAMELFGTEVAPLVRAEVARRSPVGVSG